MDSVKWIQKCFNIVDQLDDSRGIGIRQLKVSFHTSRNDVLTVFQIAVLRTLGKGPCHN